MNNNKKHSIRWLIVRKSEINLLPVSYSANQHGTPRPGERNYGRRYPVAYCENGINYGQANVAVAGEVRVILANTVQHGFLCEKKSLKINSFGEWQSRIYLWNWYFIDKRNKELFYSTHEIGCNKLQFYFLMMIPFMLAESENWVH